MLSNGLSFSSQLISSEDTKPVETGLHFQRGTRELYPSTSWGRKHSRGHLSSTLSHASGSLGDMPQASWIHGEHKVWFRNCSRHRMRRLLQTATHIRHPAPAQPPSHSEEEWDAGRRAWWTPVRGHVLPLGHWALGRRSRPPDFSSAAPPTTRTLPWSSPNRQAQTSFSKLGLPTT